MTWAEDSDEEHEFSRPLPPEDRLWRHPAEWSAEQRAVATPVRAPRRFDALRDAGRLWRGDQASSRRNTLTVAGISALGGALLVTGLFLTLDATSSPVAEGTLGGIETIARNPVVPVPLELNADQWAEVVAFETAPGIVRVDVGGTDVVGSAVVFRSDGLLMTATSLVQDSSSVTVTMRTGEIHQAQVLGADEVSGIAVLRVDGADLPTAPLGVLNPAPEVGQPVVALDGTTLVDGLTMAEVSGTGVRAGVTEDMNLHGLVVLNRPPPAHSTGGAVVDSSGAVIGIVVDVGSSNATFAVPVGYARGIAEDLVHLGQALHPWMGIRGVDLTPTLARSNGLLGGVLLTEVVGEGPAHSGGLVTDDIVLAVDDITVRSMSDLVIILRRYTPGDEVSVQLMRDGETHMMDLTLTLRPSQN